MSMRLSWSSAATLRSVNSPIFGLDFAQLYRDLAAQICQAQCARHSIRSTVEGHNGNTLPLLIGDHDGVVAGRSGPNCRAQLGMLLSVAVVCSGHRTFGSCRAFASTAFHERRRGWLMCDKK
jgi:hypothetical protein